MSDLDSKPSRSLHVEQSADQTRLIGFVAVFLAVFLVIATIANGSVFWLRSVGWVQPDIAAACQQNQQSFYTAAETAFKQSAPLEPQVYENYVTNRKQCASRLRGNSGGMIVSKLAKDAFFVLLLCSLFFIWRRNSYSRACIASFDSKILFIAIGLLGLGLVIGFMRNGWPVVAAGLRANVFLLVAALSLLSGYARLFLKTFLIALVVCLLAQLALIIPEMQKGFYIFSGRALGVSESFRMVGTFLQPASLGVTAALALALLLPSTGPHSKVNSEMLNLKPLTTALITLALVFLVWLSASAGAVVITLFVLIYQLIIYASRKSGASTKPFVMALLSLGAGVLALIIFLPDLTGRSDVLHSMRIRLDKVTLYWAQIDSIWIKTFGLGAGGGTNSLSTLFGLIKPNAGIDYVSYAGLRVDNVPLVLLTQFGLFGAAIFGALFCYLVYQSEHYRLPLLAFMLAGVGANTLELFPVNCLAGLLIAASLIDVGASKSVRRA